MKNLICIGMLIVMSAMNAFGQKISGRVVDEAGDGISYVSVGIMNSPVGVVADSRGYFILTLPDSIDDAEELSFSHVSYGLLSIGISEIKSIVSSGKNLEIVLISKDYVIEEVMVFGGKMKKSKFTRTGVRVPRGVGVPKGIGSEIGSVIDVAGGVVLSNIDFRVLRNTCGRVRMRINVYRIDSDSRDLTGDGMENETDGDRINTASMVKLAKDMEKGNIKSNRIDSTLLVNVLHVPIYCDIPASKKSQNFSVSPNENVVLTSGRYYISLEIVEIENNGAFQFPLFLHKSYSRDNSMGGIRKIPVNIGLSVRGYELSDR